MRARRPRIARCSRMRGLRCISRSWVRQHRRHTKRKTFPLLLEQRWKCAFQRHRPRSYVWNGTIVRDWYEPELRLSLRATRAHNGILRPRSRHTEGHIHRNAPNLPTSTGWFQHVHVPVSTNSERAKIATACTSASAAVHTNLAKSASGAADTTTAAWGASFSSITTPVDSSISEPADATAASTLVSQPPRTKCLSRPFKS
jgi:hypothetical protein